MTPIFMFYDNNILFYIFEKFRLNLNSESFYVVKKSVKTLYKKLK